VTSSATTDRADVTAKHAEVGEPVADIPSSRYSEPYRPRERNQPWHYDCEPSRASHGLRCALPFVVAKLTIGHGWLKVGSDAFPARYSAWPFLRG
jgi:hypothetical protein